MSSGRDRLPLPDSAGPGPSRDVATLGLNRRASRRVVLAGLGATGVPLLAAGQGRRAAVGRARQATPVAEMLGALELVREERPTYAARPEPGGRLRLLRPPVGTEADQLNFSPVAFRQDFQVLASHLDPLVWADEVTMEPRPWLAERWEWSADGTTITYSLRTDVRWHDGEPLTADDVVFSLLIARDDVDSGVRNFFVLMDEAEAVDEGTVRVSLTEADGGWLLNASNLFIVQRAQYIEHWQSRPEGERTLSGYDWGTRAPLGTGPWTVRGRGVAGVELRRHEDYWAGPPHLDTLSVGWEEDADERLEAWREGEADLLWPLRSADLPEVEDVPGRLYVADAASVMFAAFNFDNPARQVPDLFDDVRVRRALSQAIDRSRYAQEVFRGFVRHEAAGTVAQPWAHDPTIVNPPRDVAAARNLLAEAGWADRDDSGVLENRAGFTFEITAILRDDSRPELVRVLRSVADDFKEIGVRLEVQSLDPEKFRDRWISRRDYDLIAYAYDLFPGFTDFDLYGSGWDIRLNPQGWNPGGYRNEAVDQAIAEALAAVDLATQREALGRLQRAANEHLFGLWFGFPQDLILVRPEILGFQPNKLWQTWDTRKLWRRSD